MVQYCCFVLFPSTTGSEVITTATTAACPKCGAISPLGKPSCCAPYAAWHGKCGNEGENKEHTWSEGVKACLRKTVYILLSVIVAHCCFCLCYPTISTRITDGEVITIGSTETLRTTSSKCSKCGISPKGNPSCCGLGGAWRGKCGNEGENTEHTLSLIHI